MNTNKIRTLQSSVYQANVLLNKANVLVTRSRYDSGTLHLTKTKRTAKSDYPTEFNKRFKRFQFCMSEIIPRREVYSNQYKIEIVGKLKL